MSLSGWPTRVRGTSGLLLLVTAAGLGGGRGGGGTGGGAGVTDATLFCSNSGLKLVWKCDSGLNVVWNLCLAVGRAVGGGGGGVGLKDWNLLGCFFGFCLGGGGGGRGAGWAPPCCRAAFSWRMASLCSGVSWRLLTSRPSSLPRISRRSASVRMMLSPEAEVGPRLGGGAGVGLAGAGRLLGGKLL